MERKVTTTSRFRGLLAIAVGLTAVAGPPVLCLGQDDPGVMQKVSEIGAMIDEVIRPMIDSGERVGIMVGVILPSGTEYFGYGETAKGNGIAPDRDTIFEIASVTKTFTALLLADMAERNLAELEDPVEDLLPSSVSMPDVMGRKVTLLDLATHTSGLPSMPSNFDSEEELNPYADYSAEMLYEFLSSYTLGRKPGLLYEYSNLGMALLGHALELKEGKSFESLVISRICEPLGMLDTRIKLPKESEQCLAQGYWGECDTNGSTTPIYRHEAVPDWDFDVFAPAGGLRSTGSDMVAYVRANMGMVETDLLPAIELAQSVSREIPSQHMEILMGWHAMDYEGAKVIMHHGATYGFNSDVAFIKEEGVGVVLLSNTYLPGLETLDEAGLGILQILRDSACMSNYARLSAEHVELQEELNDLNSTLALLNSDYTLLQNELDDLRSSKDQLNSSHERLLQNEAAMARRLSDVRKAMYLFLGTTLLLAVISAYAAGRRGRAERPVS